MRWHECQKLVVSRPIMKGFQWGTSLADKINSKSWVLKVKQFRQTQSQRCMFQEVFEQDIIEIWEIEKDDDKRAALKEAEYINV